MESLPKLKISKLIIFTWIFLIVSTINLRTYNSFLIDEYESIYLHRYISLILASICLLLIFFK